MTMSIRRIWPVLAASAVAASASAQKPLTIERQWAGCHTIVTDSERLACYDAITAPPPRTASAVRVPAKLDDGPLTSTLRAASLGGAGGWTFVLADGSRWTQADDAPIGRRPVAGDAVEVRRGVLGSFRLKLGRGGTVKVKPLR